MEPQHFKDSARRFFCNLHDQLESADAADAVFLAGGGEDSAAALLHFARGMERLKLPTKMRIHPIYMDYGQLVSKVEQYCVSKQCEIVGKNSSFVEFAPLKILVDPLRDEIMATQGLLTGGQGSAYIEYRNIRYLTTAAAYASMVGARWIIAGLAPAVMSVDSGYAANVATQFALDQNTLDAKARVRLYAPIILAHRSACVRYLHTHNYEGAPLPSFSCYTPRIISEYETKIHGDTYIPCGTCLSCQVRIGGHRLGGYPELFKEICVVEPKYEAKEVK